MKRFLILLLLIPLVWTCRKEPPYLSISPAFYEAPIEGGPLSIKVETNLEVSYTIEDNGLSWIQGPGGSFRESEVLFTISPNDIYEPRTTLIVFRTADGSLSKNLIIHQNGEEDILLDEHSFHLDGEAQTLTIKPRSNVFFKVKSQADWITPVETKGLVESTLTFAIAANDSFSPREGTILLTSEELTRTVTVLQDEKDIVLIDPEFVFPGERGTVEVPFSANTQADFELEPGTDWISYLETRSETKKTLVFSLSENRSGTLRSAALTFRDTHGEAIAASKIIQLSQGQEIVISVHGNAWQAPRLECPYWLTDWGDGYWSPFNTRETHTFGDSGSHIIRIHESGTAAITLSVKGLDVIDLSNSSLCAQ